MTRDFAYMPPAADPLVLYEDDDLIVISKPAGLLSVPGRLQEHRDSALTRLEMRYGKLGVVHRLDMDTSGLLVFARTDHTLKGLHQQFSQRSVDKRYQAWVDGCPPTPTGLIDQPLICDWPNRPKQIVDHDQGKPSQTRWEVITEHSEYSTVALAPITGRSHQLRVHMQWLGHPILGDRFYASGPVLSKSSRLMLHATELKITHPVSGERLAFNDTSENRLEQSHLIV